MQANQAHGDEREWTLDDAGRWLRSLRGAEAQMYADPVADPEAGPDVDPEDSEDSEDGEEDMTLTERSHVARLRYRLSADDATQALQGAHWTVSHENADHAGLGASSADTGDDDASDEAEIQRIAETLAGARGTTLEALKPYDLQQIYLDAARKQSALKKASRI